MIVRALITATCVALLFGAPSAQDADLDARARAVLDNLRAGDYEAAVADFDATMSSVLGPARLGPTWEGLIVQVGAFEKVESVRRETLPAHTAVIMTCAFERASLDMRVVFDTDAKVAGLFFQPVSEAAPQPESGPPPYADPASFEERDVTVGTGEWELPGTLTIPKTGRPIPGVVLVHGSGPNDRDETIGPNKPFRDLAWGLATRGVAVLRYEKRTRHYAERLAEVVESITVKEEVVDDAVAATRALRAAPEVDAERVFVLGHSLGGTLVPRIDGAGAEASGYIVMAGASRPLEDLILEQVSYIADLDGERSAAETANIEQLRERVARVKSPDLSVDTPREDLPLSVAAPYWLDLRGYEPATEAARIARPVFVLQAERDYQVTMTDFNGWRSALDGRPDVTLRSYPGLNHLFIAGEGDGLSRPADYERPGHVAKAVVDDIAKWIRSGGAPPE